MNVQGVWQFGQARGQPGSEAVSVNLALQPGQFQVYDFSGTISIW